MLARATLVTLAGALLIGALSLGCDRGHPGTAAPGPPPPSPVLPDEPSPLPGALPSPSTTPIGPLLRTGNVVSATAAGFWSWALLDTRTGTLVGSTNLAAQSDTASMSKAWIAADYLRRAAEARRRPSATVLAELSTMIRDSDTKHAFEFHVANGNLGSIKRMVAMCGLTDTTGVQNSWSLTRMSARDVARLAACVGDGRAAGPTWTGWLLNEMRSVRGPGRFGVIEIAPPQEQVAIKNGWLLRDDKQWHIACLAVGNGWALGVLARYAGSLGKDRGATLCRTVAQQLMA